MRPTAGARVLLRTCARYATLLGNAGYVSRKGESLLRDHVVAACTVEWARGQIQRAYGHFRCRRPKSGCRETWLSLTFRYYFRARPPQDRSRRKKNAHRLSRAPWEAHETAADASVAEASVRYVQRSSHGVATNSVGTTHAAAAAQCQLSRLEDNQTICSLSSHPDIPSLPPLSSRVSQEKPKATARTSAVTTGGSSSRDTTGTSLISTQMEAKNQICEA